jgi:hypothetical protein
MTNFKRIVAVLALFSGLAVFSYGETFYSFTVGLIRMTEIFPEEDFDRTLSGANANFAFLFVSEKSPWGIFTQTSLFIPGSTYERKGEEALPLDYSSSWDLRICITPTYTFKPGEKTRIPISFGPVFTLSGEDYYDGYGYYDVYQESTRKFYEAWGMGLFLDVSFLVLFNSWVLGNSNNSFFLRNGVSLGFDFLRMEKGEMQSAFREPGSVRLKDVPFRAPSVSIFFGMGLRFD